MMQQSSHVYPCVWCMDFSVGTVLRENFLLQLNWLTSSERSLSLPPNSSSSFPLRSSFDGWCVVRRRRRRTLRSPGSFLRFSPLSLDDDACSPFSPSAFLSEIPCSLMCPPFSLSLSSIPRCPCGPFWSVEPLVAAHIHLYTWLLLLLTDHFFSFFPFLLPSRLTNCLPNFLIRLRCNPHLERKRGRGWVSEKAIDEETHTQRPESHILADVIDVRHMITDCISSSIRITGWPVVSQRWLVHEKQSIDPQIISLICCSLSLSSISH